MKTLILFLSLNFLALNLFGQTSSQSISGDYLVVLQYISNFSYSSTGVYIYSNPSNQYGFVEDGMVAMQGNYDYNHAKCSKEYWKLKKLQLVNESNKAQLDSYRNVVLPKVEQSIRTVDLTLSSNTGKMLNYICKIYEHKPIMDEINLLGAIDKELRRLYLKDPDTFHKSARYKEMGLVLNRLATCSWDQIPKLAFEYGLIGYGSAR